MSPTTSPYAGTTPVASLQSPGSGPVTLVEGRTFLLADANGDVVSDSPLGLFVLDTRVLSRWSLHLNGHRLEALAVDRRAPYAVSFAGRGRAAPGTIDADLVVFRHRHIGSGMRERLVATNYGLESVSLVIELLCDADFANLFEVKEGRVRPGRLRSVHLRPGQLEIEDHPPAAPTRTIIRPAGDADMVPGVITWRATIAPGETWEACVEVTVSMGGEVLEPQFRCGGDDTIAPPTGRMRSWQATVPEVETDHEALTLALHQAREDLGALRIFDPARPDLPVIAAGAPWFMTVFGRDSLITAWMALIADSTLAHGVLETLAALQGDQVNPITEEEPGKILHEIRHGYGGPQLDRGDVYYGSVDATPLFVMLLGELRRWDPSDQLVDRLLPHADRALAWILDHGDRDGDGFIEYERRNPHGLVNQGWKDSWDAIRHADGSLARPPIALCEVQGYVYAAYVARAHLAKEGGDLATSERWAQQARELHERFNEVFWIDELGTYALGLDADKRPIAAVASNVGHCLWTGIVDPDRAGRVADRLLAPDMFNGWGVRTLASSMPAYNPVSYHNGSVWPHDNAICAAGLSRYGYVEHANRIIAAQLDAAAASHGRLPELFSGFDRSELGVPASYPTSCSPQAWAAGSPLLWLRTLLRLDPWATRSEVWLEPHLPATIGRLRVAGIRVSDRRLTVEVTNGSHSATTEVIGGEGVEVKHTARPPLSSWLVP